MTSKISSTVLAFCAALICSKCVFADDPGDLFPDVPYAEKVAASPVTHQEDSLKKVPPPQPEPEVPVPPEPTTPPAPGPTLPTTPQPHHKPAKPTSPAPVSTGARSIWAPYSQTLFAPFLSPDSRAKFDGEYASLIQTALHGTLEARRATSDQLFQTAGTLNGLPSLQRYLYLHALGLSIHGAAPIPDRAKKAKAVMPLLNERSIAVAQTRADCLDNLAQSSLSSASDGLITMVAHAYATLAELQAQAGYPKEAAASLKTARHWAPLLHEHNALLTSQLLATSDWVSRSTLAAGTISGFTKTLAANPKDPVANTQLALIQLGLFGDLAAALPYAANSDRPEFKKLAELCKDLNLNEMTAVSQDNAAKSMEIIEALANAAKTVPIGQFNPDHFLVANLANHKLAAIADAAPRADVQRVRLVIKRASEKIMDKADPYESLAEIPTSEDEDGKTYRSIIDMFAGCRTLPQQYANNNSLLAEATNAWLRKNAVGNTLHCTAQFLFANAPFGKGDHAVIPANLAIANYQVGDVFYNIKIEAQFPQSMAEKVNQMQSGQVVDISGAIGSVDVQAYYGDCNITIRLTRKTPKNDAPK